jgi:lipoprotein-anchoring transpeptidase ErfK/SrfK
MRSTAKLAIAVILALTSMDFASSPAYAQGAWPFLSWFDQARPRERWRGAEPRRELGGPRRARTGPARMQPQAPVQAAAASVRLLRAELPAPPATALVAVISLASQSITVWDQSGQLMQSRVSTGQPGYATPTGIFSVIQKARYHESNIYSGAPMPFMQRITWSGIALHEGVVPNYPASHGCIRLPAGFAPKLWAVGRVGMRVIVAPTDISVRPIEHAALPQPHFVNADAFEEALGFTDNPLDAGEPVLPAATAEDGRLNPFEVAVRLKKAAALAVETKKALARDALAAAAEASATAHAAVAELREARVEFETAFAEAASQARTADTSDAQIDRAAAKIAADNRLVDARRRLNAAVAAEVEKEPAAFAAARAAREAEIAADEAPEFAQQAARRVEPVSIFISRKEGQIFVRQGFEQVLDSPIDIADAPEPLGTHVFTAMAPTADGAGLTWTAVTMPGAPGRRGGAAHAALERVIMPPHIREQIARRLWTGASLVISDEGISRETGKGTDFVVLTK